MTNASRYKSDENLRRRRQAIDELHFVYLKLGHMFTALTRRVSLHPLSDLFTAQYRSGRIIDDRFVRKAFEHGTPARPCVCDEAAALVDEVHHAERSARRDHRLHVVVNALREVRVFLLRTWQQLIELVDDDEPDFRKELVHLQRQEAELHRELVETGKKLAA